jgi:serine/threonine protein kinase
LDYNYEREQMVTDETDHTLDLLREADLWCDRYELALQKGERLSPEEFLIRHGKDAARASDKLLAEMRKLEVAYVESATSATPRDTEVLEPSAKKRVGRYELLRPLGSGGFGEVWVAFDPQLDREIAIKIPHAGILGDAASVGRFYREAKAAAKLKHPNIVRVHDAGSDGSTHFIAAEFIPGRTLREYCAPGGMDIREAVRIVADIAAAVFYAHRSNIVHRDIKPGNILMDETNQPHLTDFGLASQLDASALTANGTVLGTPIYMAPEQAAGRFGAALPACDQYSLGTVLYELLTGRPPFSGSNSVVLYHKLNSSPPSPSSIRSEIPSEVEAICLKAMERIPEKRFPDCEAMAVALRNWLDGKTPPKSRKVLRSLPVAISIFAVPLILVAAALLYQLVRKPGDSDKVVASTLGEPFQPKGLGAPKTRLPTGMQAPVASSGSKQPPTPANAKFLDTSFYLPLNPSVPRKVVEFNEIHAVQIDELVAWLKGLGPNYFPSVIGEHVTALPKQYHAVAYRLNLPVPYRVDLSRSIGDETELLKNLDLTGFRSIAYAEQLYQSGPDGEILRCSIRDTDYFWYTGGDYPNFEEQLIDLKSRDFRPIMIVPRMSRERGDRMINSICAHQKTNWQAAQLLTIETLREFAELSRQEKRFLFQVRGEQTEEKQLRFYAIALDNPDNLEWDYQFDMSATEYEAQLIRRKALGFRPTTVTSYGDPAAPQYAAAWIRYFEPTE